MKPSRPRLVLCLLLSRSVALAQSAAPPEAPAPLESTPAASAEALLAEGLEARKAGDDRAALSAFQRAVTLEPSARALAQVALAEQALGRWADAYEHLRTALARERDAWVNEHRTALVEALGEIERQLGSLDVTCNVRGASVEVDGRVLGRTPLAAPLRLAAGQSVIGVSAPGYFKIVRQVHVDAGELARIDVTLTPNTPPAPAPAPRATVSSPQPSASRDVLFYGSVGLAALGLTGGVTGLVMREVNVRAYNDDSRCYQDPQVPRSTACPDEARAYQRGQVIAIVGFSTAAVFGALGLYLWLDRPKATAQSGTRCAVGAVAVACSGSF